jgi:hypothetical protein
MRWQLAWLCSLVFIDMVVVALLASETNRRWWHKIVIASGRWYPLLYDLGWTQPEVDHPEIFLFIHRIRTRPIALCRRILVVVGLHLSCLVFGGRDGGLRAVVRVFALLKVRCRWLSSSDEHQLSTC